MENEQTKINRKHYIGTSTHILSLLSSEIGEVYMRIGVCLQFQTHWIQSNSGNLMETCSQTNVTHHTIQNIFGSEIRCIVIYDKAKK